MAKEDGKEGEELQRLGCQSFQSVARMKAAAFHGTDGASGKEREDGKNLDRLFGLK